VWGTHTIHSLTYVYFIYLAMKMEPTVSSETSAIRTQTPGNYPKRNKLHSSELSFYVCTFFVFRQNSLLGSAGNISKTEKLFCLSFYFGYFTYVNFIKARLCWAIFCFNRVYFAAFWFWRSLCLHLKVYASTYLLFLQRRNDVAYSSSLTKPLSPDHVTDQNYHRPCSCPK